MEEYRIRDLSQFLALWQNVYAATDERGWEHILPYYDRDIFFKDSIQSIRGIRAFTGMTQRLMKRSKNLEFIVHHSVMQGDLIFLEWEMVMSYKIYPRSSVYGTTRILLRDGKVFEQRDYYDLWGDILDNIPFLGRAYRWFMRKKFG